MAIKQKDRNRADLVKTIIKQNGGKIFTVVAKRKAPKVSYVCKDTGETLKPTEYRKLLKLDPSVVDKFIEEVDNFMTLTCRTGVKKELRGGKSTISHCDDLISVNLTNGKGYRCFSAFNVLELRASGTVISFKEVDVLNFGEEN
ncbi:hypothetical protein VPHD529_0018 [Vibrio phage D529]